MGSTTTYEGYYLPDDGEVGWCNALNANFIAIDASIHTLTTGGGGGGGGTIAGDWAAPGLPVDSDATVGFYDDTGDSGGIGWRGYQPSSCKTYGALSDALYLTHEMDPGDGT